MRLQRFFRPVILLLGATAPAFAQRESRDRNMVPPPYWLNQPQGRESRGPGRMPQAGSGPGHTQQPQQHRRLRSNDERRGVWHGQRARHWQSEHRDWQERGGYEGYRIPEARYRSGFGPRHAFRLRRQPVAIIGGFINFQFGGFGFSILDPLPEYWSEDWYDSDDVYIDDVGGGYYLRSRRHPQDHVSLSITLR